MRKYKFLAAFTRRNKLSEKEVNETVIKQLGNDVKKEYSGPLLALATGRSIIGDTPLASGERETKNRVKNVLNYKKPGFLVVAMAMLLCIVLTGCLAANSPDTVAEQNFNKDGNIKDTDYIIKSGEYIVQLPQEYSDKITIRPTDELDTKTIIELYQSATLDKHPELGWQTGFLFRIVRHTKAEFEHYWPYEVTPVDHFAKDENYFYSIEWPSDVQSDVDENIRAEYSILREKGSDIISWFITDNNLTEYDNFEVETAEYTYPGVHAAFTVTLSNDEKFTVILSKPIRQDDDGIWCVERMYQENGNILIAVPETDLTAMEYYEQMQLETDVGQHPELLDAQAVALAYLDSVWDYARHIKSHNIEYINTQ